jgi:hypothetical protein
MRLLADHFCCNRQAVHKAVRHYFAFSMGESKNSITVKLKVKVTLEQATKALRGNRGVALLFL